MPKTIDFVVSAVSESGRKVKRCARNVRESVGGSNGCPSHNVCGRDDPVICGIRWKSIQCP